jgi:hypothetical protein
VVDMAPIPLAKYFQPAGNQPGRRGRY